MRTQKNVGCFASHLGGSFETAVSPQTVRNALILLRKLAIMSRSKQAAFVGSPLSETISPKQCQFARVESRDLHIAISESVYGMGGAVNIALF
jgi:hypothetical protein